MAKKPPVLVLSSLDPIGAYPADAPKLISSTLLDVEPISTTGNGSATIDTGVTPSGVPTSGWSLNVGNDTGFRGGRLEAEFSGGGGSGAVGFFTINPANGQLQSITITSAGSGYVGVVTATPKRCPIAYVVYDLGADWHQYRDARVSAAGLPESSIIRISGKIARENGGRDGGAPLLTATYKELALSPFSGQFPGMMVMLGGRFVQFNVDQGRAALPTSQLVLTVFPT